MSALNVFKVFIGNLPSNLTEGEIRNLLRETQVDDGSILEIMLRRQHAIVSFNEQPVADAVIDNLHSKRMMGRVLKVEPAIDVSNSSSHTTETQVKHPFEMEMARCELMNKFKSIMMFFCPSLLPLTNYARKKGASTKVKEEKFFLDMKKLADKISSFEKKITESSVNVDDYVKIAQSVLEKIQLLPVELSFCFLGNLIKFDLITISTQELKDSLETIRSIYKKEKDKPKEVIFSHINGDKKVYAGDRKYVNGWCICLRWRADLMDHLKKTKCLTKYLALCEKKLASGSSTKTCYLCADCDCTTPRECVIKYITFTKLRHGHLYCMKAAAKTNGFGGEAKVVAGESGAGPSSVAGENPEEPSSSVGEKSESRDGGESGTEPSVTGDNENPEEPSSTVDEESENPLGDGDGERDAGLGDDENPENGKTPSDIGGPSSEEPSGPSEPQYDITILEDYTDDGDHRVGKYIPQWAKKENLDKALVYQIPRGNTDLSTLVFSKDHRSLRDLFPEKYATTTPATVDSNNSTTTDSDTNDDNDINDKERDSMSSHPDSNKEAEGGGNKSVQSGHADDKNGNEADEVGGGNEAGKKGSKSLRKRSFSIGARLAKSRGQKPSNN